MQSETRVDTRVKINTSIAVMLQSYIRRSLLKKRFSHCLILPKKISVRRAKVTLGRLKQNSRWQHLTISILFVLNIFIKNLLITKSIEDICDLFNWRTSSPYRRTGICLCRRTLSSLFSSSSALAAGHRSTVPTQTVVLYTQRTVGFVQSELLASIVQAYSKLSQERFELNS